MGRRAQFSKLPAILLQRSSRGRPLHRQLYETLRDLILSGELPRGTRLPSTRLLANTLGISRNTVLSAYEELCARNYLVSRIGSGTCVNATPRKEEPGGPLIPPLAFASPSRARPELNIQLILKRSHYAMRRMNFVDQDGSSLYLFVCDAL